jgi:hypothetical protein
VNLSNRAVKTKSAQDLAAAIEERELTTGYMLEK